MPYIHRKTHGYVILSRYRGKNHTHQLSDDAAAQLQAARGEIEGLEITVAELMDLKRAGDAYFVGKKSKPEHKQPTPPRPPGPEPIQVEAPATTPLPMPSVIDSIMCPACKLPTSSSAAFCSRCGIPLTPNRKASHWLRWLVLWATIVSALLAYQAAKNWLP